MFNRALKPKPKPEPAKQPENPLDAAKKWAKGLEEMRREISNL